MRAKIFALLERDIQNLPSAYISKAQKPKTLANKVHAILLILGTVFSEWHWITWKVYSGSDFSDLYRISSGVKNMLQLLVRINYFDDNESRCIFATVVNRMEAIENEFKTYIGSGYDLTMEDGSELKPLWSKELVVKYKALAAELYKTYGSIVPLAVATDASSSTSGSKKRTGNNEQFSVAEEEIDSAPKAKKVK